MEKEAPRPVDRLGIAWNAFSDLTTLAFGADPGHSFMGWLRLQVLMFFPALLGIVGCAGSGTGVPLPSPPGQQVKVLPAMFQDEASGIHESFQIRNRSQNRVTIDRVRPSCTCTTARLDRYELEPGEVTSLHLLGDWSHREGPMSMVCSIESDSGASWSCAVKTWIYRRVESSPERASFGALDPRERAKKELVISAYSRGSAPPDPRIDAGRSVRPFTVLVGPSHVDSLDDGIVVRRVPVTISFGGTAGDEDSGPRSAQIHVSAGQGEQVHELNVPLYWAIQSRYELSPPRAFFGSVENLDSLKREIKIRRADGRPFQVEDVSCSHPAFQGTTRSRSAAVEQTILVVLNPQAVQRFAFGKLRIRVHDSDVSVTLPLAAMRGPIRHNAGNDSSTPQEKE